MSRYLLVFTDVPLSPLFSSSIQYHTFHLKKFHVNYDRYKIRSVMMTYGAQKLST